MKTIYYKISLLILIFIGGTQFVSAQKFEKEYHESFKVNKDVVISINTYYTDVVIENWNKNTVDISAKITVEGDSLKQEDANKYFENWQFDASGNKEKIKIRGKNNRFGGLYENLVLREIAEVPEMPEYPEYPEMPELSIRNLDILDSFKFSAPVLNEKMLESLKNLEVDSLNFDFDAYKKDKNYLKNWQKEARKKHHLIYFQRTFSDTLQHKKEIKKLKGELIKAKIEMAKQRKEIIVERQKLLKNQKLIRNKQRDAAKKIRAVLIKRKRVKLKKTIYIKVPKGAKFNMNVNYGSVKFPS